MIKDYSFRCSVATYIVSYIEYRQKAGRHVETIFYTILTFDRFLQEMKYTNGTSKNSLFVSCFFQVIFFENFIANIHQSIFVCNLMLFLYLIYIHVFNNFTCSRQDTLIP
jgi:hypothetical protein